ncbi:hypothetical protein ACFPPA_02105 [Rhodanobacter ginsengisoli]|uniref:Uncharacterized protein n=1 Tax=Rhodanobacter ginsengisoli TaxID=418646 RepID=A0ABW0QPB9_9GAMM
MSRATDPMRMNWLWRLICEVADVQAAEMVEALQDMQVAVDQQRVRSWSVSDRDDSFFPMTIAEVERNMRALVASRIAMRADRDELDGNSAGAARGAFGAGNGTPDDEREPHGTAQGADRAVVAEEAVGDA